MEWKADVVTAVFQGRGIAASEGEADAAPGGQEQHTLVLFTQTLSSSRNMPCPSAAALGSRWPRGMARRAGGVWLSSQPLVRETLSLAWHCPRQPCCPPVRLPENQKVLSAALATGTDTSSYPHFCRNISYPGKWLSQPSPSPDAGRRPVLTELGLHVPYLHQASARATGHVTPTRPAQNPH